jgi:hypothetical protein
MKSFLKLYSVLLASALTLSACTNPLSNGLPRSTFDEAHQPGLPNQNVAPVASNVTITTSINTLIASTLIASDSNSDTLVFNIATSPTKGVVVITDAATGAFTYTPNNNEVGADSFTFKVNDGNLDSNVATVSVTISTVAFTNTWPFDFLSDAFYTFTNTVIRLTGGVAELIATVQKDNSATETTDSTITNGTKSGVVFGTLTDGVNSGLKLGDDGVCNGDSSDCAKSDAAEIYELSSSWTPQWASLVSYWKMNESSWNGTASEVADSKGTNHGVRVGDGTTTSSAKIGSHAGTFDGTGDYIDVGNVAALNLTGNLAMSIWVKPASIAINAKIIGKSNGGGSGYWLRQANATVQFFGVNSSNVATGNVLSAGIWTHIVGVRTSTTLIIYVNGVASISTDLGGSVNASAGTNFSIGHRTDAGTEPFNGLLDDAAIWSTALTANEVQTIYDRQKSAYSGTFTSRIMDAKSSSSWTTLSWVPTLPFYKELPDYSGGAIQNETSNSTTGYSSLVGSIGSTGANDLMTGIIGLWHFNESSAAATIYDDSGQSNNTASPSTTYVTKGVASLLGSGLSFNGTNWSFSLNFANSAALYTTEMTVSYWANFSDTATHAKILRNSGPFILAVNANKIYNEIFDSAGANFGCATGALSPGNWYNIAFTYKTNGQVISYLNGSPMCTVAASANNIRAFSGTTIQVNGYSVLNGTMDEVAIWNRALHANEVKQLYQRGASRLKYQVRSCDDNACSGESWQGPDGTNGTYFSELNNNTIPISGAGDVKATLPSMLFSNFTSAPSANQYFQYRAIFESDSPTSALQPELKSTTIDPIHYPKYLSTDTTPGNTIIGQNGVAFYELNSFTQTLGAGGCSNGVFYNLGLSNTGPWKYWTGATWATADGSAAQANSAAALVASSNASLTAFTTDVGRGSVFFKAFLTSDGISKCELDNILVGGNH